MNSEVPRCLTRWLREVGPERRKQLFYGVRDDAPWFGHTHDIVTHIYRHPLVLEELNAFFGGNLELCYPQNVILTVELLEKTYREAVSQIWISDQEWAAFRIMVETLAPEVGSCYLAWLEEYILMFISAKPQSELSLEHA